MAASANPWLLIRSSRKRRVNDTSSDNMSELTSTVKKSSSTRSNLTVPCTPINPVSGGNYHYLKQVFFCCFISVWKFLHSRTGSIVYDKFNLDVFLDTQYLYKWLIFGVMLSLGNSRCVMVGSLTEYRNFHNIFISIYLSCYVMLCYVDIILIYSRENNK